ncbi:unnamed protein product, partial [Pylaiella littoralis]
PTATAAVQCVRWQRALHGLENMTDASPATFRPLINVSPDTLSFELFPNSQPGCVLTVGNASEVPIAFKVKTTEPRRYLVRPNQGMVGPGESEPVNVYLIEKECNQLLREGIRTPSYLGMVGDKFLVQTAGLGNKESALLSSVTAAKQSEALTNIWATFNKTTIRNKKLSVKIYLARDAAAAVAPQAASNTKAGSALSPARPPGADSAPSASPGSRTSPAGTPIGGTYRARNGARGSVSRGGGGEGGGIGGGLDENSRVLANKYDDLVNYTANLTEERDELNASLEEAKKSLQREMATRIALESRGQMPLSKKVRPHAIISYDRSAAVANALEPRLAWFRLLVWSPSVSVSGRGVSRAARSSGMPVEVVACVACVC